MTQAMVDALALVGLVVASAGAGWWGRATVDEWRMRRMLVAIKDRIAERH